MHLLVQRLVNHRAVPELTMRILDIWSVLHEGQGVLHPVDIVAVGEVLLGMGTSRLLPCLCRMDFLHGLIEQVLKLERLDEVGVPNHAAIRNADILVLLQNAIHDVLALGEVCRIAVHRRILLHVDLQLTPPC